MPAHDSIPRWKALLARRLLLVVLLFALGFALRTFLATRKPVDLQAFVTVEPIRLAQSLLRKGAYVDAYAEGTGPSAHAAPAYPVLIAAVIHLVGDGESMALILVVLSCAVSSLAFALALPVCDRIGLHPLTGFAAAAIGTLLPANFLSQTGGYFETSYAGLAFILLFLAAVSIAKTENWNLRSGILFGIATGLTAYFNPAMLPVAILWMAAVAWFQQRPATTQFAIAGALAILITLAPWAIRNRIAFGETVWTRSNLGLEIDLSNRDGVSALSEVNIGRHGTEANWPVTHPCLDPAEADKVRRFGEPLYARLRLENATQWVRSHPAEFAKLTAQRFFYFWFPPLPRLLQSIVEALLSIGGCIGAILLTRRRQPAGWFLLTAVVVFPAAYYVIQATPRYRFPIEPVLLVGFAAAFDLAVRRWQQTGS
jgi:hypothetical protein